MKRLFTCFAVALMALAGGCQYDDSDIWQEIETIKTDIARLNGELSSLRTLVEAQQQGKTIVSVEESTEGYTITFSDQSTVVIRHGEKGADAPEVGIDLFEGAYYWTLGGKEQWITDAAGEKIPVAGRPGQPGEPGEAGKAPVLAVDAEGYWTVDGERIKDAAGAEVKAAGTAGDSFFGGVDTTDPDFVIFTLADEAGTQLRIPRAVELKIEIEGIGEQGIALAAGATQQYAVTTTGVEDFTLSKPDGWKVALADGKLTVTAPDAANPYAEREGEIAIVATAAGGSCRIVKIACRVVEVRVLTFEDADYKGEDNGGLGIADWSSLIDTEQYEGPLLYPETTDWLYNWNDDGNTYLSSSFTNNYYDYKFWGGGHALSNYAGTDLSEGDYLHQLQVCTTGGHNGSANFCIHNGSNKYGLSSMLPQLRFTDGVARTVDHMWVMNTTYVVNAIVNGDAMNPAFGEEDFLKIVAIGLDASGKEVGTTEFFLTRGTEYVEEWTRWDLSSLGAVAAIAFNVEGSQNSTYGLNTPAYFAYDDVAVLF